MDFAKGTSFSSQIDWRSYGRRRFFRNEWDHRFEIFFTHFKQLFFLLLPASFQSELPEQRHNFLVNYRLSKCMFMFLFWDVVETLENGWSVELNFRRERFSLNVVQKQTPTTTTKNIYILNAFFAEIHLTDQLRLVCRCVIMNKFDISTHAWGWSILLVTFAQFRQNTVCGELQALVYDILPPTTAIISYTLGVGKLS